MRPEPAQILKGPWPAPVPGRASRPERPGRPGTHPSVVPGSSGSGPTVANRLSELDRPALEELALAAIGEVARSHEALRHIADLGCARSSGRCAEYADGLLCARCEALAYLDALP